MTIASSALWNRAWWLAVATMVYNVLEGYVSMWFGLEDEAVALFGFGADSMIEVVSAIGIVHYVGRLRKHGTAERDQFERTALRVTGGAFYALVVLLVTTATLSVVYGHSPETTIPGVVISLISISFIWALIRAKISVGTALESAPILADANCSRVCLRMSIVLLVSSVLFSITGIGYVDAIGALGLAWYSWNEGRECFEKARNGTCCSDDSCHA